MAHLAMHLVALHRSDKKYDAPVVEQQHIAGFHIARQFLVIQTDTTLVAHFAIGVENERITRIKRDLAVLELADADFRPLQIGHDADGASDLATDFAHHCGALEMVLGGAMREVQPYDVDPGEEHTLENLRVAG